MNKKGKQQKRILIRCLIDLECRNNKRGRWISEDNSLLTMIITEEAIKASDFVVEAELKEAILKIKEYWELHNWFGDKK